MKFSVLIFVCLACSTLGNPVDPSTEVAGNVRDLDLLVGTKALVMDLIRNLGAAAEQAKESIDTFKAGLEYQAKKFEEKILREVQKLKDRIDVFIKGIYDKLTGLGDGVKTCIDANKETAEHMYKQTLEEIKKCGQHRVEEVGDMITTLMTLCDNATEYTKDTLADVKHCYGPTVDSKPDIINLGKCLGSIAVQTELKAAGFLAQSGLLVGRINMSLATLPAGLEMCAGKGLFQAGVDTGKVIKEMVVCSATSVYDAYTTNHGQNSNSTLVNAL